MAVNSNDTSNEAAEAMRASAWPKGILSQNYETAALNAGSDEPRNEQEQRNRDARDKHDEQDEALTAQLSGVRAGRMDLGGAGGARDKRAEQARDERQKARNESTYLAILQAQLDQLNSDINALNLEIDNILDPYLTDAERDYLDGIEDPDEKAREQMRIAREKLESGEMSPEEFARFEERWNERQHKMEARAEGAQIKTEAEAREFIEKYDAGTAHAAALKGLVGESQENVYQVVDENRENGNAAKKSAVHDDLGGWGLPGGKDSKLADLKDHAKGEFKDVAANTEATNPTPDDGNHPPSSPLPSGDKLTLL